MNRLLGGEYDKFTGGRYDRDGARAGRSIYATFQRVDAAGPRGGCDERAVRHVRHETIGRSLVEPGAEQERGEEDSGRKHAEKVSGDGRRRVAGLREN